MPTPFLPWQKPYVSSRKLSAHEKSRRNILPAAFFMLAGFSQTVIPLMDDGVPDTGYAPCFFTSEKGLSVVDSAMTLRAAP